MVGEQVVLLDTNAYSALYVTPEETARKQGYPLEGWRTALRGHRALIAFQTRAEVLIGARSAKWGEPRMKALNERLDATPTVHLDEDVFEAYVTLTVDARAQGKGIGQREHAADRWIAACAIAKSVPLLSKDDIFADAPALSRFQATDVWCPPVAKSQLAADSTASAVHNWVVLTNADPTESDVGFEVDRVTVEG